jgi:hypothetical protein
MTTPLKGMSKSEGMACAITKAPSISSEWVACRMYQVTAAEFMPLPIMDTKFAENSRASGRFRNTARILVSVTDFRAAFLAPEVHGSRKNCTTPELRNPQQE